MTSNILQGLKILIVDDVPAMREVMKVILNRHGCEDIRMEPSAETGLKALLEARYDVALVDYRLGDRTGAQLIWKLRSLSGCPNRDIPILVLTGQTETEIITEIRAAGADALLLKPVPPDRLAKRVLELSRRERSALPAAPKAAAAGGDDSDDGGDGAGSEADAPDSGAPDEAPDGDASIQI